MDVAQEYSQSLQHDWALTKSTQWIMTLRPSPLHKITAYLPKALPKLQADFLLANILAEPLHELADQFANLVKPQGKIVLSGILEEQTEPLIVRYGRWFSLDSPMTEDGWVRLSGSRRA